MATIVFCRSMMWIPLRSAKMYFFIRGSQRLVWCPGRIADQSLEVFAVLFGQPVFPRIGTEHALLLLPGGTIPDKRHDARVGHAFHGDRLGLVEGAKQIDRQPGMLVGQLLAQAGDVHDRENAGALVVRHLFRLVVGEQARHARVFGEERLDEIGMKHGVELALGQHGLDRFLLGQQLVFDIGRQRHVDVVVELGHPFDAVERHAVFALQDAAHP